MFRKPFKIYGFFYSFVYFSGINWYTIGELWSFSKVNHPIGEYQGSNNLFLNL